MWEITNLQLDQRGRIMLPCSLFSSGVRSKRCTKFGLHSLKLTGRPLKNGGWNTTFLSARPTLRSCVSFRDGMSTSEKLNGLSQKFEGFDNKRTRNFAKTEIYTFQSLGVHYYHQKFQVPKIEVLT